MEQNAALSRRAVLPALAASSLLGITLPMAQAASIDAHLIGLGRDFDVVAAKVDHDTASGTDVDWQVLDGLARLDAEIVATPAFTTEGLCVKARVACWALLGDLDPAGPSTTDKRMALSIVRDLIRLYDPDLERPDALRKLVEDVESDAVVAA